MCLFSSCPKNICPMSIVHQLVIWLTPSFVCPSDLGMSSCPMLSWPYFGFLSSTIDNAFYPKHLCILWLWSLRLLFLGFLFLPEWQMHSKCVLFLLWSNVNLSLLNSIMFVPICTFCSHTTWIYSLKRKQLVNWLVIHCIRTSSWGVYNERCACWCISELCDSFVYAMLFSGSNLQMSGRGCLQHWQHRHPHVPSCHYQGGETSLQRHYNSQVWLLVLVLWLELLLNKTATCFCLTLFWVWMIKPSYFGPSPVCIPVK